MSTQDASRTMGDYLGILRRRRIYLLTIVPAALLLAVYLAYVLTPAYRSSATILLEPSSISEELVQTTVTSYADQQIELVSRRVLLADSLEELVARVDPYPEETGLSNREKAQRIVADTMIERVDPITFKPLMQSNAFSIHYHNADPKRAAEVAQQIADMFMGYNRKTRSERAAAAYDFLLAQSQDVEKRIGEVDQRIANFKARHGAALPESQGRQEAAAERASRDLMGVESQIRGAEERLALLNVQLAKLTPTLGSTAGNPQTELAMLQGQLADARVRYTPDHPDVKRLERQIEALAARPAAASSGAPNNPDYLAVQSQIDATRRELAALSSIASRARGQIYTFEAGMNAAPEVEKEYADLARNRDALQKQFADIQVKLRDADIARNLETEQKGERFSLIRPPYASSTPYSPNRMGIILLGFVLGGGLAMGFAALAESSDSTVRSSSDLRALTAVPVVAAIPALLNDQDRRRRRIGWGAYATALTAAVVLVAATVVMA